MLLRHVPTSVALARSLLEQDLTAHGFQGRGAYDAVLVVSELVSNALKHAHPLRDGGVRLAWELDGDAVQVQVTDGGSSTRPVVARPAVSSLGGRGLAIVSALSAAWGVHDGVGGTTVWARIPRR